MLLSCHDKVKRFTDLSLRLAQYVHDQGADEQAATAASRIRHYFQVAAPLHHQDEEKDLFPALESLFETGQDRQQGTQVLEQMELLRKQHSTLESTWAEVDEWLEQITRHERVAAPALLQQFVDLYRQHMHIEENFVFPFAEQLDKHQQAEICLQMAMRRGLKSPNSKDSE